MRLHVMIAARVVVSTIAIDGETAFAQSYASDAPTAADNLTLGKKEHSPYPTRTFPDWVLWDDTHLQTSYSTDAGMIGNFLGPDEAFRFSRGETVRTSAGQRAKLIRRLDFLVVADHSENLGLAPLIAVSDPDLLRIPFSAQVHNLVKAGDGFGAFSTMVRIQPFRHLPNRLWEHHSITVSSRIRG